MGLFVMFFFFFWELIFPPKSYKSKAELRACSCSTKNENDVFFKNEKGTFIYLFYFETLKPISEFKFDFGKSFGGNDQNTLFPLCFGQLLRYHSHNLCLTIIKGTSKYK